MEEEEEEEEEEEGGRERGWGVGGEIDECVHVVPPCLI